VLPFEARPLGNSLESRHDLTADEWFDRGQRLEEEEDYDPAAAAYRNAIALAGRFPEALFNLANVLRALGRPEAAEELYRLCVAQDPGQACAWYNLADVLEEQGRLEEAIASLQAALRASPTFADAHFNLASACGRAGQPEKASNHWRAYLALDPNSQWSAVARQHLRNLTHDQG
jgi:tetratricopeptide (TPR) repeat protein